VLSTILSISLDERFDKSKNYYCQLGGETRGGSGAAVLGVACKEVLEKELLPRVLESCTGVIPVSSPWFVPTSITKWLPRFLAAGGGIKPQLLGPVEW